MAEEKNPIYEPRKFYDGQLKKQVHEAAEAKFDELVAAAKTDVTMNRKHVKEYDALCAERDGMAKKAGTYKGLKTLFIVLMILCWIVGILMLFIGIVEGITALDIVGPIVFATGFGALALMLLFRSKQKSADSKLAEIQKRADKKLQECYADMAELNASYDWNMPTEILEKATPILDFDKHFSVGRFHYLVEKFGLPESLGATTSVQGVLSGNIQGNPFVLERDLTEEIVEKSYTNSITIHWTTSTHDKDGTHVHHHSQVLTATVIHPGPDYATTTRLIYGNEAAPHLCFTRYPCGKSGASDKELARFVKSRGKELDKKVKRDLMDNDSSTNFTKMGNEKFDALFGADDRNNEVEFRALYTPLAQKNIIDLLTNPAPFGDDFVQHKDHMLNSVASAHSQSFDYSASPERYVHYDIDAAKKIFVDYCDSYIRNIYFDLAPLISVPLYQVHKPIEYIYDEKTYGSNFSAYEQEVMANGLDVKSFLPEKADPSLPLILKVEHSSKHGNNDVCSIRAISFRTTPRTDIVNKMGGDGRMHSIPVPWIQYDEVSSVSDMVISEVGGSARQYHESVNPNCKASFRDGNSHYERGLMSYALGDGFNKDIDKNIRSLFSNEKK